MGYAVFSKPWKAKICPEEDEGDFILQSLEHVIYDNDNIDGEHAQFANTAGSAFCIFNPFVFLDVYKRQGSSVADGIQLTKTKQIIEADPERRYIVVSAPGKRFDGDNKITDLLYLCKTHMEHNLPYDQVFQVVTDRFMAVELNLGVEVDLQEHFDRIKENLKKGCSADYIASRGEYLNAVRCV